MPEPDPDAFSDALIAVAAAAFRVLDGMIVGPSRTRDCVDARSSVAWLLRERGHKLVTIGNRLGGRDHSTIMHLLAVFPSRRVRPEFERRFRLVERAVLAFESAHGNPNHRAAGGTTYAGNGTPDRSTAASTERDASRPEGAHEEAGALPEGNDR